MAASAKELFLDALELPPEQREAFLAEASAGDEALAARVRALLSAHASAETRLGADPVSWTAIVGARTRSSDEALSAAALRPGDRVGPYVLREELGEGGFGTVWRARQESPVRREVALKVVKLGMDTRAVVARLQAERQALALMEHPHIAKVLDAGATDSGRPYFVMELVAGEPITTFCKRRGLGLAARLRLFATVCHAIQHAHSKGVIHRDVKPSNVLVAEVDGRPVPKVIDFGIAKALHGSLTDETLLTHDGHVLGTPASMSPEQLLPGGDVDTRADVYALGALLYELLTGRPPLEVGGTPLAELQRIAREVDPVRPSAVRGERDTGARLLLPPDLDWIALRCLEKERDRRYPTAYALARDVERFLDGHPVEAAPPSVLYRVRKLARRHRAATVAACALLLALLVGVSGLLAGLLAAQRANAQLDAALEESQRNEARAKEAEAAAREAAEQALAAEALARASEAAAREAEGRAEAEAAEARRQADIAAEVVAFLNQDLLGAAAPASAPGRGRETTVRQILDVASARLDAGGGRFAQAPLVEASVREMVGGAYTVLGLLEPAERHLSRALALRQEHHGGDVRATARTRHAYAEVLRQGGRLTEAAALFEEIADTAARLSGEDAPLALLARSTLALTQLDLGLYDEAADGLRHVAERAAATLGPDDPLVEDARANRALAEAARGNEAEAEVLLRDVLSRRRARLGDRDPLTLATAVNLANLLRGAGRAEQAEALYVEWLPRLDDVMGSDHLDTLAARHGHGRLMLDLGRWDEAETLLRATHAGLSSALGPAHAETLSAQGALARVYELTGRLEQAEALVREALALAREAYGDGHPATLTRAKELTSILYGRGDLSGSLALVQEVLAAEIDAYGEAHPSTLSSRMNLAILRMELGQPQEAEAQFRAALEGARRVNGPDALDTLEIQSNLAAFLCGEQRWSEAEELARDAVARAEAAFGGEAAPLATHLVRLGASLHGQSRLDEAEDVLRRAHAILQPTFGPSHYRTQEALEHLLEIARERGDAGGVAEWEALLRGS